MLSFMWQHPSCARCLVDALWLHSINPGFCPSTHPHRPSWSTCNSKVWPGQTHPPPHLRWSLYLGWVVGHLFLSYTGFSLNSCFPLKLSSGHHWGDMGSIPGLGRSPGGGHGCPLQWTSLKNPMGRRAWKAAVHGVAQSRTWLSMHAQQQKQSSQGSQGDHPDSVTFFYPSFNSTCHKRSRKLTKPNQQNPVLWELSRSLKCKDIFFFFPFKFSLICLQCEVIKVWLCYAQFRKISF